MIRKSNLHKKRPIPPGFEEDARNEAITYSALRRIYKAQTSTANRWLDELGIDKKVRQYFKKVEEIDAFGNVIGVYPSMSEAARMTGAKQNTISQHCNGLRKNTKKLKWRFAD